MGTIRCGRTEIPVWVAGALALATVVVAGCGGGSGGSPPPAGGVTANSSTASNSNGSVKLTVGKLSLNAGEETSISVELKDANGAPLVNEEAQFSAGSRLDIITPAGGVGRTNASGRLDGRVQAVSGGDVDITVTATDGSLPVATLTISVFAPVLTAAATQTPTGPQAPTITPTAVSAVRVAVIKVQADRRSISSADGGVVHVSVRAFDENNVALQGIRLLLDANPRVGTVFSNETPTTDAEGSAASDLTISPGAPVGQLTISASAGAASDAIAIDIVSGTSQRKVVTIVLESDQPTIGTDSGGTASLKARVFDVDNVGIPDVNVIFQTEVGQVSPTTEVTCGGTVNPCPPSDVGLAQTTLTVPPGAILKEYNLKASAGGLSGTTVISVVPGRGGIGTGNPNAAAGQPSAITLGASPTRIQVVGTGGTEQSTIVARVFDNNNNPLVGAKVAFRVVPDSADGAHILPLSQPTPIATPTSTGSPVPTPAFHCLDDPGRAQAMSEGRLGIGVSDRAGFVLLSLKAGTRKGTVSVEACADSANADGQTVTTIVDTQSLVTVAAGPPALLTLAVNNVFVDNNDGTLLTTVAALVKDTYGNTVEDGTAVSFQITNRQDVSIIGGSTTNQLPACDISQFSSQTGIPITAQPGNAVACMIYPRAQAGTVVRILAESVGITNEDNNVDDEEFNLPPGSTTGPAVGVPSAKGFSLAASPLNLSGRLEFGLESTITAFVTDRLGNPVSSNTIVHFTTDGGGITSQNVTDQVGRTTATLQTQQPIPADGITTVTATVRGEEDFTDVNGNGQYDPGVDGFDPATQDQNGDGVWTADSDISAQIAIVFSGLTRIHVTPGGFTLNPGGTECFDVHLSDNLDNPLVAGTTVSATTSGPITVLGPIQAGVGDTNLTCAQSLQCDFQFCIGPTQVVMDTTVASVTFSVVSDNQAGGGNGTRAVTLIGSVLPPPPTPTPIPTATP